MAYRPRVEMSTEEYVRELLEKWRPRYNAPANDSVAVTDAQEEGAKTREEILRVIDRLADERRIMYAPAVSAALDAAKARHPHYNFNSYSFERRILDKAEELKFDICSSQDLGDVCEWMISQPDERVPLSAYGREVEQQQSEAKQVAERRLQLLSSILAGRKTTYEKWDPQRYKIVYVDATALESKSIAELEQIEREVLDLRRKQGQSSKDQMRELQRVADSHKDYKPYRPGDKDSLDTDAVPTQWDSDDKSPIAGRVDARSYKKNEKVVVGAAIAAAPDDPFISKVSGREITKAEACAFVKHDLPMFRKLMKKDLARLNRIIN